MSAGKVRQGGVFVEIGADARQFFSALQRVNRQIASAGRAMQSFGAKMAAVGTALAAPLALAARQFATFDDAIRATAAVSGATGAALQSMNDRARELGATTSFTAVQVANLMTELGRAGFKPDEINAMTGSVLNLARATGTEASRAAGIMSATLRQFGLDAGDAARSADVLTKAANATFNTVEGLGESLKYAGPVAKELGMSLEDTVAILGVLGNVGIQGSSAGMALKRLSVISAASGDQLQELFGISNTDAAGNLKPLVDVLEEINQVTAGMPVADRTAKMAKAFGLLGITSASVLSNTAGGVRGLADELRNAQGTAANTAKEMDAGLGGSMRIALSAIEGTALAVGEALAPSLQKLVDGVAAVAGGLTKFVKDNEDVVVSFAKGVGVFVVAGGALVALGASVQVASFALGGLLKVFVALPATILSSVAALAKYIMATVAAGVASVFAAAKAAAAWIAATAPLWLVAAAVAGVAAAVYAFGGQIKQVFGAVPGLAGRAGSGIKSGFSGMVQDAIKVFSDLGQTASTTFKGIYDAIVAGDLAGAMDILWDGLQAAWLRGVEGIMSYVDSFVTDFQNTFTYLAANLQTEWNLVMRGMEASWDDVEKLYRKAKNFLSAAFKGADAVALADIAIDNEMAGRVAERNRRYGNADPQAAAETAVAERFQRNDERAAARRAATQAAEQRLGQLVSGQRDTGIFRGQADDVIGSLGTASTMQAVRELAEEFHLLAQTGALTESQLKKFSEAADEAGERIEGDRGAAGTDPDKIKKGGGEAVRSQADVAGTFSAAAVGGMGFGQSIAQKQLDVLKGIHDELKDKEGALVGD
jgi:TP901 family phage tail tape measure protein